MNPLTEAFHSFLQRAKEKRDRKLAEKLASEFKGYDLFLGNETNSEFNTICAIGPVALPTILSMFKGDKWILITETSRELITKMRTPETLATLVSMLSDPNNEFRRPACRVLGFWREKSVAEKLVSIALDEKESLALRKTALDALGRIGDHSTTFPILSLISPLARLIFNNPDEKLVKSCIAALGEIGDKRAIPYLRELMAIYLPYREAAVVSLAELGDTDSVPDMIEMTQSRFKNEYNAGAEALCTIRDPRGGKPLANLLLAWGHHANDISGTIQILKFLGELGDESAIPAIFAVARFQPHSTNEKREAIRALSKFRCDASYSALAELLSSMSHEFMIDVKLALIEIGAPAIQFILPRLETKGWEQAATMLVEMHCGVNAINFIRKSTIRNPEMRHEYFERTQYVLKAMKTMKHSLGNVSRIKYSGLSLSRAGAPRPFPPRRESFFQPKARIQKTARPV